MISVDYAILIASRHWPDVAERAIVSIRRFSDAPIMLIDDASPDERSRIGYRELRLKYDLWLCRSERWLQHGLALDMGLDEAMKQGIARSPYTCAHWVITCDHDVIVNEERAFTLLLEKAADDVGAVGRMYNNAACAEFGTYVHPHWALWNADAIRRYSLSWRSFQLRRKSGKPSVFATGQFLSYQLQTIGLGAPSWVAPGTPLKLVPVNVGQAITHAQVKERGEAWHQKVRLQNDG